MKKMLGAFIALSVLATPALAGPPSKGKPYGGGYWSEFGSGGEVTNQGLALGGFATTGSTSTKHLYGGSHVDMTGVKSVYSGVDLGTSGFAKSFDKGYGGAGSFTSESGYVTGGAFVGWGKGTPD